MVPLKMHCHHSNCSITRHQIFPWNTHAEQHTLSYAIVTSTFCFFNWTLSFPFFPNLFVAMKKLSRNCLKKKKLSDTWKYIVSVVNSTLSCRMGNKNVPLWTKFWYNSSATSFSPLCPYYSSLLAFCPLTDFTPLLLTVCHLYILCPIFSVGDH